MADINEVRQRMMDELEQKIRNDPQLASIRAKIQSGDPNVASQYAVRCGQILSGVACEHINDEIFQNSTVADLASMLVPVIQRENEMVANAAAASQRNMNEDVGIGIRPQRTEFDASQYYNIFGRMQIYDSFDEAEYLLEEPLIQDSLVIVDEAMRENAEFQYRSGLKTCVIREVEADCCDWGAEREGTYYFPDVPDEVWERHNDCRCEIRIETEKDENNRYLSNSNTKNDRVTSLEKQFSDDGQLLPQAREAVIKARQENGDMVKPSSMNGDYYGFQEIDISEERLNDLLELNKFSKQSDYEYGKMVYPGSNENPFTDKKHNSITFDLRGITSNHIELYHSHTDESTPSIEDLHAFIDTRIDKIGIISINGDAWIVDGSVGFRPGNDKEFSDIAKMYRQSAYDMIVNDPSFYSWTYEERYYMLVREQFRMIANHYEWDVMGGNVYE